MLWSPTIQLFPYHRLTRRQPDNAEAGIGLTSWHSSCATRTNSHCTSPCIPNPICVRPMRAANRAAARAGKPYTDLRTIDDPDDQLFTVPKTITNHHPFN